MHHARLKYILEKLIVVNGALGSTDHRSEASKNSEPEKAFHGKGKLSKKLGYLSQAYKKGKISRKAAEPQRRERREGRDNRRQRERERTGETDWMRLMESIP